MASPSPQHSQMDPSISLNFRAPPPSPVPSNRRSSSVTNDDILTDFLAHTLRVPDLILPDRIFPKQIRPSPDIPVVDFKVLDSLAGTVIRDSLASIGCFELVNHEAAMVAEAGGVFRVSSAGKRKAARAAPEAEYGYEVMGEEEEEEMSEEFVWGRDFGFKIKMEEIWPRYSNFSEKMEILSTQIEKVARNIMLVLLDDHNDNNNMNNKAKHGKGPTSVCYIHKHPRGISADRCISSLRYDVIRMMIKGSDYSHALSFHLCEESTEFHVYSKRGWLSFIPTPHSLVVTALMTRKESRREEYTGTDWLQPSGVHRSQIMAGSEKKSVRERAALAGRERVFQ